MKYAIVAIGLLVGAVSVATADDFGPISASFAGPNASGYGYTLPKPATSPSKSQIRTEYAGDALLESVSDKVEGTLERRLEKALREPAARPGPVEFRSASAD